MIPALTFDRKRFIGVVHLKPLPASPRFAGSVDAILNAALADATAYQRGFADAIFIENFGDVPFTKVAVGTETVAAMAVNGLDDRSRSIGANIFNVLCNSAHVTRALSAVLRLLINSVNVSTRVAS